MDLLFSENAQLHFTTRGCKMKLQGVFPFINAYSAYSVKNDIV